MFDEIEEDEREIRRLQRGELFRRPKPKLPEQQGDVMERRVDIVIEAREIAAKIEPERKTALCKALTHTALLFQSQEMIRRLADETEAQRKAVDVVLVQHAALVEQRDRLAAALRECVRLIEHDSELVRELAKPAVLRAAKDALAAVEQGEESR